VFGLYAVYIAYNVLYYT